MLGLRLFIRAWWYVFTGDACEWHRCNARSRTVRTDIGGQAFALCSEHAVEGLALGYWRGRV
jgi:hypothetical protein